VGNWFVKAYLLWCQVRGDPDSDRLNIDKFPSEVSVLAAAEMGNAAAFTFWLALSEHACKRPLLDPVFATPALSPNNWKSFPTALWGAGYLALASVMLPNG